MNAYDTVSQAMNDLKKRGYDLDFEMKENYLVQGDKKYSPSEFEITEVYRFEGMTDPGDEEIIYAIESHHGEKGVLVNGYGIYGDPVGDELAKKLTMHRQPGS